ncbi:MAG: acylphosphatase [Desulfarculaceae bacterium]|nr:acylphosphatase [Desulfarculaceae bacterium]
MNSELINVRIKISGRVQGVFYRAETQKAAGRHNIKGWVRNLPGGDVEAVFEGEREDVEKMVDWCRKGPPASSVTSVKTEKNSTLENFTDFQITY